MATFSVEIAGLVCHIANTENAGDEFYKHAALVDEQTHHQPYIYIFGDDLIPRQTLPFFQEIKKYELISFESASGRAGGIKAGLARADARFRNAVPSLQVVTEKANIDGAIKTAGRNSNVLAYVRYCEGSLTSGAHFPMQAEYRLNDTVVIPIQCAAAFTEFFAEDHGHNTNVVISKVPQNGGDPVKVRSVTVRSGGRVVISNTTTHGGPRHFEHYKKLTDAETVAMVVKSFDPCNDWSIATFDEFHHALAGRSPSSARMVQFLRDRRSAQLAGSGLFPKADPDPECSNTRWP